LRSGRRLHEFELPGDSFPPPLFPKKIVFTSLEQVHRDSKKLFLSQIGTSSGIPEGSIPWILSDRVDTRANFSPILSRSEMSFTSTAT
jgi:hypothetical protein